MATEAQKRAKAKYNSSHYSRLSVDIPQELMYSFRETCDRNKVSIASVIKDFIAEYVEDNRL